MKFHFILLNFLCIQSAFGQFVLNGDAEMIGPDCYRLTEALNEQSGAMWHIDKIDLNESFEVAAQVFLGCKDDGGADGIVFVFQSANTQVGVGGEGGGIGFLGINPAIAIEMDTWFNGQYADPTEDHLAIISNGSVQHTADSNLAGPVAIRSDGANVEDCEFHSLDVSWNADTETLSVYFECELRLSYNGDIVNEIFNGDPLVFWGFTSATGGANNKHEICFDYTSFLEAPEDVTLCPGGNIQLNAAGGISYLWSPADYLSDPTIANPIANPPITTLYEVSITDDCGKVFIEEVLVEVNGAIANFSLGPDTLLCEGDSYFLDATTPNATYLWSNGSTNENIEVLYSSDYSVTITIDNCIAADYVYIDYLDAPNIDFPEDTLLCSNAILELNSATKFANFLWQDGSTDSIFIVKEAGNYNLTVFNLCGTVNEAIDVAYDDCDEVFMPNIFSPNDDGFNDIWTLYAGDDVIEILELKIFNRWGNLVFENNNFTPNEISTGWDGRFKSKILSQDVYVFYAIVQYIDGSTKLKTGDITLLR